VSEWHCCHQRSFRRQEGRLRVRRPFKPFRTSSQKIRQRLESACRGRQKPAVKIYQTEKLLELLDVRWRGKFLDGLHVAWQRDNAIAIYHVPQEFH
jgi:hypothetical protein